MDQHRLQELADRSYSGGNYTFTDFLSVAELATFYEMERELQYASPTLFGGSDLAERQMIRFGNPDEIGYEQPFPIAALLIRPLMEKFSDDLTHRDFLGAWMDLGIRRGLLGGIFVKDNRACVFCKESIADFIISELTRIKHTSVKVSLADEDLVSQVTAPVLEDKMIQVASCRIDAVIAKTYNLSRSDALALFPAGLVYRNGKVCTENARELAAEDVISARGYGKFQFAGEQTVSKKGKLNCVVRIYK